MPKTATKSRDSFWSDNDNDEDGTELNMSASRDSYSRPSSRQSSQYIPTKRTRSKLSDHRKSPNSERPAWVETNIEDSLPPSDYTITHVNQTHEYMVRMPSLSEMVLELIGNFT